MPTLASLLTSAHAAVTSGGTPAYWDDAPRTLPDGTPGAPTDPAYLVLQLSNDAAARDFDGEAYATARLIVRAWAQHPEAALNLITNATAALKPLGWARSDTYDLGRDAPYSGFAAEYDLTH